MAKKESKPTAGSPNSVSTVNEKHEMKALVKAEADAIITNYPDIAVEIVKNA